MRVLAIITVLAACGDDGGATSAEMMEACSIVCDCGFNTVPEIEMCTKQCIEGPKYSAECDQCISDHEGRCTTLDDCDAICQGQ